MSGFGKTAKELSGSRVAGGIVGQMSQMAAVVQPFLAATQVKPTMPTPDDAAMKAARKRSIANQRRRMGRASTILTGDEPLGG